MSETELSRAIQAALARLGIWCVRVQSGSRSGGKMQLAVKGTPDLCLPALGWLEVKTPGGERLASQVAWHARAGREGVRVATVRSVEQAVRVARQWESESPRHSGQAVNQVSGQR